MEKKAIIFSLLIWVIIGIISVSIVPSSQAMLRMTKQNIYQNYLHQDTLDYVDITVSEAWDLLTTTDNGIQLPIDVRTDSEWTEERIDTPYPEFPRHFEKNDILDEEGYELFVQLYNGSDVIVYCKGGSRSAAAAQTLSDRGFGGTIYNMKGGINDWKLEGYSTNVDNNPPATPSTPTGTSVCTINVSYDFNTQSEDIDGDAIRYGIDWDADSIVDEWTDYLASGDPGTITHSWNITGDYEFSVLAEDHVGVSSDFSPPHAVSINTPPMIPTMNGPDRGKPGEAQTYTIVSVDTENDQISYYIEWGDGEFTGWSRTLASGEMLTVNHVWEDQDTYLIRAKARDELNAESDWTTLEVRMPHTKSISGIHRYIHNHPLISLLFSSLKGLN